MHRSTGPYKEGRNHESVEFSHPTSTGHGTLLELGPSRFDSVISMAALQVFRTSKRRRLGQQLGVCFAALVLSGCSSTYGTNAASSNSQSASSAPSTSSTGTGADAGVATTALGKIVVDGKGMTAYFFDKDIANSGKSACTGQCAAIWPAITSKSATPSVTGVTGNVGTITGVAGDKQVTINGRPIYTYADDTAPGDTNGQGVSGIWYIVSPSGAEIRSVPKGRY